MACFGCRCQCIYEVSSDDPVPCIKNISVEQVWMEIDRVINESERNHA
jgi:hypothetical protein